MDNVKNFFGILKTKIFYNQDGKYKFINDSIKIIDYID